MVSKEHMGGEAMMEGHSGLMQVVKCREGPEVREAARKDTTLSPHRGLILALPIHGPL